MNKQTSRTGSEPIGIRQIAVIIVVAATIAMNILANALPLNGQNTGDISDRFPVYFVPAGYVFSIWGLIYIGLIAYAVYQALPAQRGNPRLRSIVAPVILSSAANVAWLFFWHYNQFPLTMVAMLILLASLIMVYLRLNADGPAESNAETWMVRIPFSVYLGWISVATIANAADVLYDLGWNGAPLQPQVWAVIMLVAAALITSAMIFLRRDAAYALVIAWAAAGIAVRQSAEPLVANAAIITAVYAGLLALLVLARPQIFKGLPRLASQR